MKLQVAGGLLLHRVNKCNFADILIPAANTLVLTGDCLSPGDPINNKFMKYLKDNWTNVIYLPGGSEMRSPGTIKNTLINYEYRVQQPLPHGYTLYGATYIPWWDISFLNREENWLYDVLKRDNNQLILASYGHIPEQALIGNIVVKIQGCNNFNQFNYTKGPITNHRASSDGQLRVDYNPKFVLELPSISPHLV